MPEQATQELKNALFRRANGKCECEMKVCTHHTGRCNTVLAGEWHAHRKKAGGPYDLGNTTAMCIRCHKNTYTYGTG